MKPYRYLLLATLSLSLFACTNGEDVDPVVPVDPNAPAALSVQIAGVALTKAGATTADISEIGLYAVNNVSGETSYGTLPNGTYGKYTTTPSGGTSFAPADESNTIWLNNQVAKIYACYPVGTITAGGTSGSPTYTIPVPASAITLAPATFSFTSESTTKALDFTTPANDYMYGVTYTDSPATFGTSQPTASNRTPSVSIGMKHAFSQIRLLINKADNYQGTPVITNVSLACKQPFLQDGSTMSLANGALSNLTTPGGGATDYNVTYTYNLTTNSVTIDGTSVATLSITNYILPSTEGGIPYKITITADGKEMELSGTTQKLDAGKINTYTISINGAGLNLSGFQIVSWDSGKVDVNVEDKL